MLKCMRVLILCSSLLSCMKSGTNHTADITPLIKLTDSLVSVNPFTYHFKVEAGSALTNLKYHWDFGEGTQRDGKSAEELVYPENKIFRIQVTVTNGNARPVVATTNISTFVSVFVADTSKKFQTINGFGGFGGQAEWWSNGPFTSTTFIDNLVNDLGVTIIRDEIPTSFEIVNDNNDPYNTDLTKFNIDSQVAGHHQPLRAHLQFMKDASAAGVDKFIAAVWSPPPWMKTNNSLNNGGNPNDPGFSDTPDSAYNQLKKADYEEFAEMLVAYVKIVKQQTGIDIYAINVQNEPRFSQPFESCIYNGPAFRDLIKTVGERFTSEGLSTILFAPEDIGYLDGVGSMVGPLLNDVVSRNMTKIVAVHGYALDGVTANSPDAQTWQTMYGWGAQYGKPLWMTETSGYSNDWKGAMDLSKAMYTALKQGNISAWLFWTFSTETIDAYSLMSSSGQKSKRYYVSKNFYRYIRPGAVRFYMEKAGDDTAKIYSLAFCNSSLHSTSVVIINDESFDKAVKFTSNTIPSSFEIYVTSSVANLNCADKGVVSSNDNILIPAGSVVTLVSK